MRSDDLPEDAARRDRVILEIFGSPDPRQIDGVGGGDPLTSKLMVVSSTIVQDVDLEYRFAQVSVDTPHVVWKGNCGNMSAAVALYALEEGLVRISSPESAVRLMNVNTMTRVDAKIPTPGGHLPNGGTFRIPGASKPNFPITLTFRKLGPSVFHKRLPTGDVVCSFESCVRDSPQVTVLDVSVPVVFVAASDVGLSGTEAAQEIDDHPSALRRLEEIRSAAAEYLGLVPAAAEASARSPSMPRIAIVSPPSDHVLATGEVVKRDQHDVVARQVAMNVTHKAYPVTGAICLAAAAALPGSVVERQIDGWTAARRTLRIAHPSGIMGCDVDVADDTPVRVQAAGIRRTARRIMKGEAFAAHAPSHT